ncbi:Pollen Ole e 1 allergen and extensin family protein [Raphanus sativus]|uniref:Uncharacterized protein LOC108825324 n=1 Tax=Raphanus sativus TaxID=3726 RepID=A0A6J0L1V8_RAPSA|nr:uncharacterized protein LOC108825324 [Raphanus sativus]KAJ4878047.1 Pollen Ole e 1 allergen and extensin family protein [Raphanus sativus]
MRSFFFILRCCFLLFSFFLFDLAFAAGGKIWSRTEMVEMAGYGEQKLSSVIITGSLLCDTSSPHHFHSIAIPGATVAIKCHTGFKRRSRWIKAVTDDLGEFEIDLPSQLHAVEDLENTCVVKPIHVPELYGCYHNSRNNTHKRIKLFSSTNSIRVYKTGKIRLQRHSSKS